MSVPRLAARAGRLRRRSLAAGVSYLTLYTSTPAPHRTRLRRLAADAREAGKGVWAADESEMFRLASQASISPPNGVLILPNWSAAAPTTSRPATRASPARCRTGSWPSRRAARARRTTSC